MRRPLLPLLLLLALSASAHAREARKFSVAPAPAWIDSAPADTSAAVPKELVRWGLYDILNDEQIRITANATAHYYRVVRKVLSTSGVENGSELSIDFDPTYQKLTLHGATIVRDGERLDALVPDEVRVIQKEDDSGDRIYDGEQTALIFLGDVRPGDVLEYSYSIDGANPLLSGRYVGRYHLTSSVPARLLRYRLIYPAARKLQWNVKETRNESIGDQQQVLWERRDVAALDVEDQLPSWYEPWEAVQLTEFTSWAEVGSWANDLFTIDTKSDNDVQALAATIRAKHPRQSAQITAAIRFVQDDIRYLGIEMGRNSHEPHQPSETLARRWGDCKDKALLLCALLRALGVEAYPALVNTEWQHRLSDRLPSPFLFDHVIAQVIAGGKTYWVDGTISEQGGTLETLDTPGYRRALIVRPGTTQLTEMIAPQRGTTRIDQTYTTPSFDEPSTLHVKSVYTGLRADSMRAYLATMSVADLAKERLNHYATDQPKIEAVGTPVISDDRDANIVTITESYRIRDLWAARGWTWYARALERYLRRPETMIREMPLAFDYPLDIAQTVTFNMPRRLGVNTSSSITDTPVFRYEYVVDANGNAITIRQSLKAKKDFVSVDEVPEHLTKINEIWDEIGYNVNPQLDDRTAAGDLNKAFDSIPSPVKWGAGIAALLLFVGICVGLAIAGRRRTGRVTALQRPRGFRPGEAPASALSASDPTEMQTHLAALRCYCGSAAHHDGETQRARYGDRDMTIVIRACVQCGREQSVYFTATA